MGIFGKKAKSVNAEIVVDARNTARILCIMRAPFNVYRKNI